MKAGLLNRFLKLGAQMANVGRSVINFSIRARNPAGF